ncbi:MAG: hypothetical protein A2W93_03300 [Bacteroidetes bacterium GWF2_43_63]|nr:MAG: hypothetical protein A2W94_09300 [Bacteroidetes bacterium GWE2_42_42]OFY53686.1 MAG: hypothetical protein A2W93_03300 [Bacteroidetes bacterium GWF2_43_63]
MNVKSLELSYENISQLTYRGNIIFYLYDPSPVDSIVEIFWGDSTYSFLTPSSVTDLPGELKKVVYSGTHTYSGPATFTMFVSYKVRSLNVINVPMSIITDIYVEAQLVVSPFLAGQKSPVFLEKPKLNVCRATSNVIDFSTYDADGDHLVYSLIPCRGEFGDPITGYYYPTSSSQFSVDPQTGWLTWNSPTVKGFFNYAVKVSKYRNGVFLGSVMRDVLANVIDCQMDSPVLTAPSDTCLIAGTSYHNTVTATYTGIDTISLTATGSPLLQASNPATFPQPVRDRDTVTSDFDWQVSCEHVRPQPYSMIFRAELEDSLSNCDCSYDFNSGQLTPFYSNVSVMFNNPCGNGWDGSTYLWFGPDSTAPRYLATPSLDISAGNYMIVFDMRFSDHTGNPGTNCEGPDEPDEGIYLQYSLSGLGGPWVTMAYWDPSLSPGEGGHVANLIDWNNYSVVAPDASLSPNTRFRWRQESATGKDYDHWGLDNISVYKISDKLTAQAETEFTIIAPAPENLTVSAFGDNAALQWNKELCTNADGYKIYRKSGASGYVPSGCETGVPSWTGYSLIATTNDINDTTYTDDFLGFGLPHGNEYCYIVTAWFANGAESQASNEACLILSDNSPVITHVSVTATSATAGSMFVDWSKPDDLDTLTYPGPYRYDIYRANDFTGISYTFLESNFGLDDTTFNDAGLNTSGIPYHYRIDLLYASGTSVYTYYSSSYPASSVFLTIIPFDQRLLLKWAFSVPWNNDSTVVYRYNDLTSVFDSIGVSHSDQYLDTGLVNGQTYCYKVETVGSYSLPGFVNPIRNFSQETCEAPMDVEPPCAVELDVSVNCDEVANYLVWTNPQIACGDGDVGGYEIYFSPMTDGEFVLVDTIADPLITTYIHTGVTSVAGCYAVVAVDTSGNSSEFSNIVCVDIDECDLYTLPNVFTPNGDGFNDFFIPFPYDFVEKIDIKIFDRWGLIMFTTQDPDINWDGKNKSTSLDCSEGVYYYICDVYEMRLAGIRKRTLTGTVHLYRSN